MVAGFILVSGIIIIIHWFNVIGIVIVFLLYLIKLGLGLGMTLSHQLGQCPQCSQELYMEHHFGVS